MQFVDAIAGRRGRYAGELEKYVCTALMTAAQRPGGSFMEGLDLCLSVEAAVYARLSQSIDVLFTMAVVVELGSPHVSRLLVVGDDLPVQGAEGVATLWCLSLVSNGTV